MRQGLSRLPDFRRLKEMLSISQVLHHRGLLGPFRKQGPRLVGPCPIHGGDNPSAFVISDHDRWWFCFSRCAQGGDVIDLVRRLDGCTHRQAGERLAALAGTAPPPPRRTAATRPSSRPFTPFVRPLRLQHRVPWLQAKGIFPETAAHFDTGAYLGSGWLQGCVAVRLHDLAGRPLGYAGRRLGWDPSATAPKWKSPAPKWQFPPGLPKSKLLFNYHRVRNHLGRGLLVVECPWAVMRLAQLRLPAVALLGVAPSHTQLQLLRAAPKLVLLLDGDTAGREASRQILRRLQPHLDAQVVLLPDGLDPDDLSDHALHRRVAPLFSSTVR